MLSIWKLRRSSSISGPRRRRTRTGRRSRRSASIVSLIGWSVPRRIGRPGVVTSTASAASRSASAEPRRSVPRSASAASMAAADGVGDGADPRPVLGRQRADAAQDAGQARPSCRGRRARAPRGRPRPARPRPTPAPRRAAPRGRGSGRRGPRPSFHGWAGNQEPSSVSDVEGSCCGWSRSASRRPGSGALGELDDPAERGRVADRQVGQDLAVDARRPPS